MRAAQRISDHPNRDAGDGCVNHSIRTQTASTGDHNSRQDHRAHNRPAAPTAEQFTLDGVKLQLFPGTGFTLLEPTQTGTYINGGSYEFRRYRHQFADNTGGESASIALQPEDDPFLKDILELPGLDDGTAEQRVECDGRCFFRFKRIGDRIVGVGFAEASAESADRLMAAIRDAK